MSYYIKRDARVSGVPTDGTVYYKGDNRWSNVFEDRKTYSDEESAVQDITTIYVPVRKLGKPKCHVFGSSECRSKH